MYTVSWKDVLLERKKVLLVDRKMSYWCREDDRQVDRKMSYW